MTMIFVAKNSGVLRAPSGEQHRLVAGKTLADGRHEAVTGSPESWLPMVVDLAVDAPGEVPAEADGLHEQIEELEAERDRLVQTLSTIADGLDVRGLASDVNRDEQGWLVTAVFAALDEPVTYEQARAVIEGVESEPTPVVIAGLADPETPEGRASIRDWAWSNGIDVAERGALPKSVIERYRAANG